MSNDLNLTPNLPPYIYSHRPHHLNPRLHILFLPQSFVPLLRRDLHTIVIDVLIEDLPSFPRMVFPVRVLEHRVLAAVFLAAGILAAGPEAAAEREEATKATEDIELAGEGIAVGGKTGSNYGEIGFDVCPDGAFASDI